MGSISLTAPVRSSAVQAAVQPAFSRVADSPSQGASLRADTVKLSLAAQVTLMHHQGLSPTSIAAQLGISVKLVNGYIPGSGPAVSTPPATTEAATREAPTAAHAPTAKTSPPVVPVVVKA